MPDLLDEALAERASPRALRDWTPEGWRETSTAELAERVEATALGMRGLGLDPGERIALYLESDSGFLALDLGALLAGLVDVPLYLTNSAETNRFVLSHSGAVALALSSAAQLPEVLPLLDEAPAVELVLVAGTSTELVAPEGWPERVRLISLHEVEAAGRALRRGEPEAGGRLRAELSPSSLATLVYTSGTTGQPKGVELTHENLSFNALAAVRAVPEALPGDDTVALCFLPLTHAFGRTLHYGFLWNGNRIAFTQPQLVGKHLREVRPSCFGAVPRVLERVFERICAAGQALGGWKARLFARALNRGAGFDPERRLGLLARLEHRLLDAAVYSKWRAAVGGRVSLVISGGAALRDDVCRTFLAAGIPVMQGYGLTEASPIVSTNRPSANRVGTVGRPLPGVEVRRADDGELLTRGPHVMRGYFRDPEATAEAIDAEGWLQTGDLCEIDDEGYIRISGRKKELFKLSTGKYVGPSPIELRLTADPLVEQAVLVGEGHKFCAALLFPATDALKAWARRRSFPAELPLEALLKRPEVLERFQQAVDAANRPLGSWETVKRFRLVEEVPTVENGLLTPTLKVKRRRVWEAQRAAIERLYEEAEREPAATAK